MCIIGPFCLQLQYLRWQVHQLLGVTGGRVSLASVAGITNELKEVVMAPTQDAFYAKVTPQLCEQFE